MVKIIKAICQQRFCKIAKYVVNSLKSFARNFILAEKTRLRSSQPRQAAKPCKTLKKTELNQY